MKQRAELEDAAFIRHELGVKMRDLELAAAAYNANASDYSGKGVADTRRTLYIWIDLYVEQVVKETCTGQQTDWAANG